MPKLKNHILPRMKDMLLKEAASNPGTNSPQISLLSSPEQNSGLSRSIIFKDDRMYRHGLARFNYTTYDVRRGQDVVNPNMPHRDIMLLAKKNDTDNNDMDASADTSSNHPFLYARVLGIFHVNVVYIGDGMLDYKPRRVEFLWVRWFEYVGPRSLRWADLRLDRIRFPPMASEGAFGFVDPGDVLRGCNIIPAFAKERVRGVGLSRCAWDTRDWNQYFVNRCVAALQEYII